MNDKTSIGVKIHDIHHGLIARSGAIIESKFGFLKELGAAIQIATTIKDHESINDLEPFYAASGELMIGKPLADVALTHLESLGFVRLKKGTGRELIRRIDVTVPNLAKIYADFGDYFLAENESPHSKLIVDMLQMLSAFPHKEKDIVSSLQMDPAQRDIILDVGKGASLLDSYISPNDSESILYSPLYWDDNPKEIFELLNTYKADEFLTAVEKIKGYQGLPESGIKEKVFADAILLGCLPTLSVTSTGGLQKFVFTPRKGVGKAEKVLLNKARILISCVRYGENFAGITKINSPELLINALAKRGFLRAHSESLHQYEAARNQGLVKIIPAALNRYEVHFIDNDENNKVAQLALEMLTVGDTAKIGVAQDAARQMLIPGNILHPTQTRTKIIDELAVPRTSTTLNMINDLLRGIE